jgi:hypothetical protein
VFDIIPADPYISPMIGPRGALRGFFFLGLALALLVLIVAAPVFFLLPAFFILSVLFQPLGVAESSDGFAFSSGIPSRFSARAPPCVPVA